MAGVKHTTQSVLTNDPGSEISKDAWNADHTVDDNSVAPAKLAVSATDKVIGRSTAGAGAGEEIALTAAGRALIDDADAAAQRTTLGVAYGVTGDMSASAEGDTVAAGAAGKVSDAGHRHAREAFGTTAAAIGTSAGGSATTPSKSDHVHASGAGTPSTQAFGDAAAVGSGPAASMTDHKHAMPAQPIVTINFVIDGGGAVITTGIKGDLVVDFACTILSWTLLPDQSGSIVVDIWKDTYANFPPVIGDVITASAKPTVTTTTKNQSSTLTGWTTSIAAGDVLRFNVNSVTTVQRVTLSLKVQKT